MKLQFPPMLWAQHMPLAETEAPLCIAQLQLPPLSTQPRQMVHTSSYQVHVDKTAVHATSSLARYFNDKNARQLQNVPLP